MSDNLTCPECGLQFDDPQELEGHLAGEHETPAPEAPEKEQPDLMSNPASIVRGT